MVTACVKPTANPALVSSSKPADSGDPEYEAMTVQIEGLRELNGGIAEISISELRALPRIDLHANYKRTTGLIEEYDMSGPLLKDTIVYAGGNLDDYAGMGMVGRDGYYCLFSREVIDGTPDFALAVEVDGDPKLDEDKRPVWAAVQGQFGPYWVKQVAKIILYENVPRKDIAGIWVFDSLAEGIDRIDYEYYGSRDKAIDLEQIFTRMDFIDGRSFFTMKSADGFKKSEAMNIVKSRYYLKIEGEDAPTNVAPYIKLGMNVQKIAWFSAGSEAVFFPRMLAEYMDIKTVNGEVGVPLDELLYEMEVGAVKSAYFDLMDTSGASYKVRGADLSGAIMAPLADGGAKVLWSDEFDYPDIGSLYKIRLATENGASAAD
jgi:hypothetical protein